MQDVSIVPVRRRILRGAVLLPFAAAVIVGLCAWKMAQPPRPRSAMRDVAGPRVVAPVFMLRDFQSQKRRVRLATFLGRHRILVAFFDAGLDSEPDPVLLRLRDRYADIERTGTKVFAISSADQEGCDHVLRTAGPFPFPMLRDPNGFTCARWGRLDPASETPQLKTLPGLFVIDRAGNVSARQVASASPGGGTLFEPFPETDPLRTIDAIAAGE